MTHEIRMGSIKVPMVAVRNKRGRGEHGRGHKVVLSLQTQTVLVNFSGKS